MRRSALLDTALLAAVLLLWLPASRDGAALGAAPIVVQASAQPPTVSPGDATLLTVVARSSTGAPLPGASVRVAATGGAFGFAAAEATGTTNERGLFRTVWRAADRSAYRTDTNCPLRVEVTKAGHGPGRAEAMVRVVVGAPAPPPAAPAIQVTASAHPPTVAAGGATWIMVVARSPGGAPLPGAGVKVAAGGGTFGDTGAKEARGVTDERGAFRTVWRTFARNVYAADMGYILDAEVIKAGHTPGRAQTLVQVKVAAPPPPPPRVQPIVVAATAQPSTVPAGGATTITVVARAANGAPVDGATARIQAGGGVFRSTNNATATGATDRRGRLIFQWRTGPKDTYRVSMAYRFTIDVTKPGHQPGKATTQVRVTVAPTPPPELPIVVAASTNPRQIAAGGAISVLVAARSASGAPLPGTSVRLEADGGLFRHTNNRLATGVTDGRGVFATQWRTDKVSAYVTNKAHQFTATVSRPGHKAAVAHTSVLVTAVKRIQ